MPAERTARELPEPSLGKALQAHESKWCFSEPVSENLRRSFQLLTQRPTPHLAEARVCPRTSCLVLVLHQPRRQLLLWLTCRCYSRRLFAGEPCSKSLQREKLHGATEFGPCLSNLRQHLCIALTGNLDPPKHVTQWSRCPTCGLSPTPTATAIEALRGFARLLSVAASSDIGPLVR